MARAIARSQTLMRELAPSRRGRHAVGGGLIRLGSRILASGVRLPAEVARTLVALRAATDRTLRA